MCTATEAACLGLLISARSGLSINRAMILSSGPPAIEVCVLSSREINAMAVRSAERHHHTPGPHDKQPLVEKLDTTCAQDARGWPFVPCETGEP